MSLVYIIAADPAGPCKVGRAVSAGERLRGLQCGNPQRLVLFATCLAGDFASQLEAAVHWRLRGKRVRGEWFAVSVSEAAWVIGQEVGGVAGRAIPVVFHVKAGRVAA